ncbi:MAG: hypothetical protein GY793_03250 [Proteobacteria bacterium]|nr:hypothetical protein [Pseudomonadota bacterium]
MSTSTTDNLVTCPITGKLYDPETEGDSIDRDVISQKIRKIIKKANFKNVSSKAWDDLIGAGVIPTGCSETVSKQGVSQTLSDVETFRIWVETVSRVNSTGGYQFYKAFKAADLANCGKKINHSDGLWKCAKNHPNVLKLNYRLQGISKIADDLLEKDYKFDLEDFEELKGLTLEKLASSWYGRVLGLFLVGHRIYEKGEIDNAINDAALVAVAATLYGDSFSSVEKAKIYLSNFKKALNPEDTGWTLVIHPKKKSRLYFKPAYKKDNERLSAEPTIPEKQSPEPPEPIGRSLWSRFIGLFKSFAA